MTTPRTPAVDPRLVRVAKVLTFRDGQQLGNATGFFFLREGYLYFITNRHVVHDDAGHLYPNKLQVLVHTNRDDLTSHGELWLEVLDAQGKPLWREHPEKGAAVDVVAIPINDPHAIATWYVDTFGPDDLYDEQRGLPLGQEVIILAFPLGFADTLHRLPLVRSATIASAYPLWFKGEPYFITDAWMHRGTSGSPVVAKVPDPAAEGLVWKLVGVHSAALDVSDRDPVQDARLGLNMAWYASLILAMTTPPTPEADASATAAPSDGQAPTEAHG